MLRILVGFQILPLALLLAVMALENPLVTLLTTGDSGRPDQDFHAKDQRIDPLAFQESSHTTLLPTGDAYVMGGDNAAANFGRESRLTVKNSSPDYSREVFLQFNLSGARNIITSARLELTPLNVGPSDELINQAALVMDNNWKEHLISWDTRPSSSTMLGSWMPVQGQPVVLDITPQVQSAARKDGQISIKIYSPRDVGGDGWVHYGARENTAAVRPRLILSTVGKLYSGAPDAFHWDSRHWNNGQPRTITEQGDESDLSKWSQKRGTGELEVDGEGILTMKGEQPRLYLNGLPEKFWKNVEVTVYYQRIQDNGTPWGGVVIGARSGPNGHTSKAPCTATTYYGRMRNDGKVDFYKELKYPQGDSRQGVGAWGAEPLPHGRWIGVKFVVYNTDNDGKVKLELYRDLTEGVDGGQWEKIIEYTDAGGWGEAEDCPYDPDHIITRGGGVVFIRNTGVQTAQYKWVSVREIVADDS